MTRPYSEGTDTWRTCLTMNQYLDAFRAIFLPPEESELARTEFKIRKQGRTEDISSYLSSKIALWQLAYGQNERSFNNLLDETIAGIANRIVKRRLRYAEITDIQVLRRQAVRLVAAERQCYREGTSESTSLDGLAATTRLAYDQRNDDDMEVDEDGMNALGRFEGNCRKCGIYGHRESNCRRGTANNGKMARGNGGEKKCHRCDRTSHLVRDCRARTKANGEAIVDKGEKKPQKGNQKGKFGKVRAQAEVSEDEENDEEECFLEEEGESEEEK